MQGSCSKDPSIPTSGFKEMEYLDPGQKVEQIGQGRELHHFRQQPFLPCCASKVIMNVN